MSWIRELYDTYENNRDKIAVPRDDGKAPLLPVAHTLQKAHVEMELSEDTTVIGVQTLNQEEADTILPCTEDSASRSSGIAPHALYDNLLYLAGDCNGYLAAKDNTSHHEAYMSQLQDWCQFPDCPKEVRVIHQYLLKGRLVQDLIEHHIFETDEMGHVKKDWTGDKKNKPLDLSKTLVRFRVQFGAGAPVPCNKNTKLFQAYQDYYLGQKQERRLCYVTGQEVAYTEKHPARLRNGGDNAKLISGNDSSGYTYRGRFRLPTDAVTVGFEVSQKAHHALRWLIDTQGWRNGEQVILSWGVSGGRYPALGGDNVDIFGNDAITEDMLRSTMASYAEKLKKALQGYGKPEGLDREDVVVMAVEAATPGRLSITYYNQAKDSDYIESLKNWYTSCFWNHKYKSVLDGINAKGKPVYKHVSFTGAPAPADIVFAAYGPRADEKVKKNTIERLLPCIVDKKPLPKDLMTKAVRRASAPQAMEGWEWHKTFTIACALVRKYRFDTDKEEWDMALDETCTDRNYLFGRLLAYADKMEQLAQYYAGASPHDTNAQKLQSAFAVHPARTWKTLDGQLRPYKSILTKRGSVLLREVNDLVLDKISIANYMSNTPLNELYLLGYAHQMAEFDRRSKERKGEEKE